MRYLRNNTACRITVGPFLDKTNGVDPETTLTVTACKLTFIVDDGNVPTLVLDVAPTASAGANDMVHITGDDAGFYDLELAAANVNYFGRAMLSITDAATHCPVFHEFMILPQNIYDSMILGTDLFQVDLQQWVGSAPAGLNTTFVRTAIAAVETDAIKAAGIEANAITAVKIATGAITAAKFAAGAIDAAAIAADAITAVKIATGAITAAKFAAGAIDAAALNADAVTEIQTGLATSAALAIVNGFLDTEIAAIKAKTDALPTDPADHSLIMAAIATVEFLLNESFPDISSRLPAVLISGRMDSHVGSVEDGAIDVSAVADGTITAAKIATDAITAAKIAADAIIKINDDVRVIRRGVIQGASPSTVTLDAGASAINGFYYGQWIYIPSGTGIGQTKLIVGYTGATKVADISPTPWAAGVQPISGDGFVILVNAQTDLGLWRQQQPLQLSAAFEVPAVLSEESTSLINDEMVDVVGVDVMAQLAQAAPPATPTMRQAIMYLYQWMRNKLTQTATETAMWDDAGTTKIAKATVANDGTTVTKDEFISGA